MIRSVKRGTNMHCTASYKIELAGKYLERPTLATTNYLHLHRVPPRRREAKARYHVDCRLGSVPV